MGRSSFNVCERLWCKVALDVDITLQLPTRFLVFGLTLPRPVADTSGSVRQGTADPRQGNTPTCFDARLRALTPSFSLFQRVTGAHERRSS
jgi:hypothetical protein